MIDIVTVVFRDELPILQLQAQSVDLYCRNIGVKDIFVVVNDSADVADQIDPDWWGSLAHCVKIVPRQTFECNFVENGWVSQQVLKMLASSLSKNTWSMILDAKTLLVSDVVLNQIMDNQGRLKFGNLDVYPVFEPSRQITNRLFDIDLKKQVGPGGVPFFFHNESIRSMIKYVEQKVNQKFAEWFQAQGMLTEFILYSGWIELCSNFDSLYTNSAPDVGLLINICHSELGIADQKLKNMSMPDTMAVGVHRNAWSRFTQEQKNMYKDFLLSRSITRAKEIL